MYRSKDETHYDKGNDNNTGEFGICAHVVVMDMLVSINVNGVPVKGITYVASKDCQRGQMVAYEGETRETKKRGRLGDNIDGDSAVRMSTNQARFRMAIYRPKCYSSAAPSFPAATSACQSRRHCAIFARSLLSPSMLSIQPSSASSSSATKNEESKDRIVSKLAELDVMWSINKTYTRTI
jgi:hypothetical protein